MHILTERIGGLALLGDTMSIVTIYWNRRRANRHCDRCRFCYSPREVELFGQTTRFCRMFREHFHCASEFFRHQFDKTARIIVPSSNNCGYCWFMKGGLVGEIKDPNSVDISKVQYNSPYCTAFCKQISMKESYSVVGRWYIVDNKNVYRYFVSPKKLPECHAQCLLGDS